MKRWLICFILSLFTAMQMDAQLSFKRTYGSGRAQSVKQTSDGGFILSGVSIVASVEYPFLMKTTATGATEWMYTYPAQPYAITTVQIIPSGYFVTIGSWALFYDTTVIACTDFLGNVTGTQKLPGNIFATNCTSNGSIIATGEYSIGNNVYDLLAAKFDSTGVLSWSKSYDNFWKNEGGYCVAEGEAGSILIGGWAQSPSTGSAEALMVKLTPQGGVLHKKEFTSAGTAFQGVTEFNGKYIFTGFGSYGSNPGFGMIVAITDTALNMFSTEYDDIWDAAEAIEVTTTFDGGLAIMIEPEGPYPNIKRSGIRKTKADLDVQWEKLYDDIGDSAYGSYPYDFVQCADSGFAIVGEGYFNSMNNPYIMLIRVDASGSLSCSDTAIITTVVNCTPASMNLMTTGVINLNNYWSSIVPSSTLVVDSILCLYNPQAVGLIDDDNTETRSLYPNPASHIIWFQFSGNPTSRTIVVTDQVGREIWREESSESVIGFPAAEFSSGVYFYTVTSDDAHSISGKFVVQH